MVQAVTTDHQTRKAADNICRGHIDIITVNAGGWTPVPDIIARADPQLVFAQEHRLAKQASEGVTQGLLLAPWSVAWQPAAVTPANGRSAGVAVLAAPFLDVVDVSWQLPAPLQSRLAAARLHTRQFGGIHVYSWYGQHAVGACGINAALVSAVCSHAAEHGEPWAAFGDFNLEPACVAGLFKEFGVAAVTHYDADHPICVVQGVERVYDFAVSCEQAAHLVESAQVCLDLACPPHRAVKFRLRVQEGNKRVLVKVPRPALPDAPPFGPRPAVHHWEPTYAAVSMQAHVAARCALAGDLGVAQAALDKGYSEWNQAAAAELLLVLGADVPSKAALAMGHQAAVRCFPCAKLLRQRLDSGPCSRKPPSCCTPGWPNLSGCLVCPPLAPRVSLVPASSRRSSPLSLAPVRSPRALMRMLALALVSRAGSWAAYSSP